LYPASATGQPIAGDAVVLVEDYALLERLKVIHARHTGKSWTAPPFIRLSWYLQLQYN